MTMAEKKVESIKKEIEKLEKSLARYTDLFNKKNEICKKLECDWTQEEMRSHSDDNTMTQKQWEAWFDRCCYQGNVEDTEGRLANAFKRLEKAEDELEGVVAKIAEDEMISKKETGWLEAMKKREEEYQKWLAEFKAECLKDGILIDEASGNHINGTTKGGNKFVMYINNGWTERSFHSYTLRIGGMTYFTSGLFSTAYKYLMRK